MSKSSDHKLEPQRHEIEELIRLVSEANKVGSQATSFAGERLRKCVAIGRQLKKWRDEAVPKKQWAAWLSQNIPDLNERTSRRWMCLAVLEAQGKLDLDSTRSLNQAYKLAQLLPDGDASGTKQSSTKPGYMVHLSRLITSLGTIIIEDLSPQEKCTIKDRFIPINNWLGKL